MMIRLRIALEAMVVATIIFAACSSSSSTPRTAEPYRVGPPDEYGVACYAVYQGISCVKVR